MSRALALNPGHSDVLLNGAIVHALAGNLTDGCTLIERALASGASPEIVRRTDELRPLKGCAAYDRVSGMLP